MGFAVVDKHHAELFYIYCFHFNLYSIACHHECRHDFCPDFENKVAIKKYKGAFPIELFNPSEQKKCGKGIFIRANGDGVSALASNRGNGGRGSRGGRSDMWWRQYSVTRNVVCVCVCVCVGGRGGERARFGFV